MTFKRMLSVLAITLAATTRAVVADPSEFDWSAGIARGGTVSIENAHGDVFVEPSDDKGIQVRAIVRDDKPVDAARWVHVNSDGQKVIVCIGYQDNCTPGSGEPNPVAGAPHIDVAIFLPDGVDIAARSADGQVAVEYATGNVVAATDKGDIHVSTSGSVNALSRSGTITIDEPKGAKLAVNAHADSGTVKSDFTPVPATVAGARKIEAHSQTGNVVIEARIEQN